MMTLTQYSKVNDNDDDGYVHDGFGNGGGSFPRRNCILNGLDDALYGKSDTGFIDEELFLRWFDPSTVNKKMSMQAGVILNKNIDISIFPEYPKVTSMENLFQPA